MNKYMEERNEYIHGGDKLINIWRREVNIYKKKRNE